MQYKIDCLTSKELKKPTRSLRFLKVLTTVLKVISMIVFVLSIIGFALTATTSVITIVGKDIFVTNTLTLETFITNNFGITVYTASFISLMVTFACGGWIAIGWLSWLYFGKNRKDKTPYTFRSARDLVRLSIVSICLAVLIAVLFGVSYGIYYANFKQQVVACGYSGFPFIAISIVFIICSFAIRHSAEVRGLLVKETNTIKALNTKLRIEKATHLKEKQALNKQIKDLTLQIEEVNKSLEKEKQSHNKTVKKLDLVIEDNVKARDKILELNKKIATFKKVLVNKIVVQSKKKNKHR